MRQVDHSPRQPASGEDVTITIKVTDDDGVDRVELDYQLVDPGDYIELNDPRYNTQWTTVTMVDDGTGGDETAGDNRFTTILAGRATNKSSVGALPSPIIRHDGQLDPGTILRRSAAELCILRLRWRFPIGQEEIDQAPRTLPMTET